MAGGRGARSIFETFWANASYKSFAKPHFREAEAESGAEVEVEAAETGLPLSNYTSPSSHDRTPSVLQDKRAPSLRLTLHQFLYIAGSHGLGAMVISGGINFALAYGRSLLGPRFRADTPLHHEKTTGANFHAHHLAMYTTNDVPVRLFQLPNTLVGDTAVTVIVQTIVTWILEMIIVKRDLRKGNIQPIGFVSEPPTTGQPWWRAVRWFMQIEDSKEKRKDQRALRRKAQYVLAQITRAFAFSVMCFAIVFGPSVGILIAVGTKDGGDWDFSKEWTPEIFKLVLGSVLALMTSPFFATFWMIKCGWDGGVHEAVRVNGDETK